MTHRRKPQHLRRERDPLANVAKLRLAFDLARESLAPLQVGRVEREGSVITLFASGGEVITRYALKVEPKKNIHHPERAAYELFEEL